MKKFMVYLSCACGITAGSFFGLSGMDDPLAGIDWGIYGAQYNKGCNIHSDSLDKVVPEVLMPYKEELLEILQKYNNGAAMNVRLDEQLMRRVGEIKATLPPACEWFNQYMVELRKDRILNAFGVVAACYLDRSFNLTEEIKAAIKSRLSEVRKSVEYLSPEEQERLKFFIGTESLLARWSTVPGTRMWRLAHQK